MELIFNQWHSYFKGSRWVQHYGQRIFALVAGFLMFIPVFLVFKEGFFVDSAVWVKLWRTRLPELLTNSLILFVTVMFGSLILGSSLSFLIERTDMPGRRWIKPLLTAPLIIPCYIIGICYISFFGHYGLLEKMLSVPFPGIKIPNIYGFWGAAWILIVGTYPYVYTILSAAIRQMDPTLSEAAKCLGGGPFKRFFKITLPILMPALLAGMGLVGLYVLSDFGVVSLLRYKTFVNVIYEQMSGRYDFKVASALSLVLVVMTFIFLFVQEVAGGRKRYATISPRVGQVQRVKLKSWKYPAMIFSLLIVMVGLIIPIAVLVYWLIQSLNIEGQELIWSHSFRDVLQSGMNSLLASSLAATIAIVISLPLVYWTVRHAKSKAGRAAAWMSQSGIALPGVLIALGLTFSFRYVNSSFSYSIGAIVIAYLVHFFAQGYQPVRSGLVQISTYLEESSRLMGMSSFKTFWLVTRPLLKSSLGAGWVLVFLSSMRELPASLLLRPAGFDTLTVKVWTAASEGFYEQAAQPALMLVVLSLPLVFVVLYGKGEHYAHE